MIKIKKSHTLLKKKERKIPDNSYGFNVFECVVKNHTPYITVVKHFSRFASVIFPLSIL
jgi:hypothetical protein